MTEFSYRAVDAKGDTIYGKLDASNESEVLGILRRQKLIPLHIGGKQRLSSRRLTFISGFTLVRQDLSRNDLIAITSELAVMLDAGQDVDRALRYLIKTTTSIRTRRILEDIRERVRDGRSLHLAMAHYPASFPKLYLGMVRAAEATGNLASTMERLAALLERERALVSTVQSAMIYPAILTLTAIGSVILLLTKVLPQFTPLFTQNGVALPTSTKVLIEIGNGIGTYGGVSLLMLAILFLVVRVALARPTLRLAVDRLMIRCPVLGPLIAEVLAARFSRILGTLLDNGVPLLSGLGIVNEALGNRAAVAVIAEATESVKSGIGLSTTLEHARIFPERMTHLLQLGEETARLGSMALRAAAIHEDQARITIQRLVAFLVPGITIIMGLIVAGIVSSLLLAMLSLNDLVQ